MSLFASIFCPVCTSPYNESQQRPRFGLCYHSICEQCQKDAKCQICGLEGAFKDVVHNYDLIRYMENLSKILESVDLQGESIPLRCKTKNCEEQARICWTCAVHYGVAEPSASGVVTIKESISKLILMDKASKFVLCAACIADGDHTGHETKKYQELGEIRRDFQFLSAATHGFLFENYCALDCEYLRDHIVKFRESAAAYQVFSKFRNLESIEDEVMMKDASWKFHTEIKGIIEAKKKALEMVKPIFTENQKLRQMQLIYDRDEIQQHLDDAKQKITETNEEDEKVKWQKTIKQLEKCKEQFAKICVIPLDSEEILVIDLEIDEKMKNLTDDQQEETPKNGEGDSKLETVQMEHERVTTQYNKCRFEWLLGRNHTIRLFISRAKTVTNLEGRYGKLVYAMEVTANKVREYEVAVMSLQNNKKLIKMLESISEVLKMRIMISKYFPKVAETTCGIFKRLLVEDREEQILWRLKFMCSI